MKQNRAEVYKVFGLNWFLLGWRFIHQSSLPPSFYIIWWYCDILGQNKLIMFKHSNRIFFTRAGHWADWEEREPITVIGSFYLLQSHPNTSPGQYPRLIRQESLKRPEARGQLGRGCGNLGGHGQPILLRARLILRAVCGSSRFFTVPGEDSYYVGPDSSPCWKRFHKNLLETLC